MTRWVVWLGLVFTLGFMLCLGLIRAQAYDDHGLNVLFAPDGLCRVRCWQGIYFGHTTVTEALDILAAHPWVAADTIVMRRGFNKDETFDGYLYWDWSGAQPEPLRDAGLTGAKIRFRDRVVESLHFTTSIPFGALWLALDPPQHGLIAPSRAYPDLYSVHLAVYAPRGLTLRSLVLRPVRMAGFWHSPVEVEFAYDVPDDYRYQLPCWLACR